MCRRYPAIGIGLHVEFPDLALQRQDHAEIAAAERQCLDRSIDHALRFDQQRPAAEMFEIAGAQQGDGIEAVAVEPVEQRLQLVAGLLFADHDFGAVAHARTEAGLAGPWRSEEHTSELQSLMRISYAVFCLKKKNRN